MSNLLYMGLMGFLLVAVLFQSGLVMADVGRGRMRSFYGLSELIALTLLIYLFLALLRPERFG